MDAFRLLNTLTAINEKYNLLEKSPRVYGKGVKVYPSQIRTIVMVGHSPGINLTELAKRLEITKASASELVSRLVESGLVRKTKDAGNIKEVQLHVTARCREIVEDVDRRHEQMFRDFKSIRGGLRETNYELVISVLKKVESHLDRYLEESRGLS